MATSKSSKHAKHSKHGGTGHVTTDHEEIRQWVEERGGFPARVAGTGNQEDPGLLRIEFQRNDRLEEIPWDEFFDKFEESKLALVYQDETHGGEESRFCKLVSRDSAKAA